MKRSVLVGFCSLMMCCKPDPVIPTTQGCPEACDILRKFKCPEGQSAHCVSVCNDIQMSGYLMIDIQCILQAQTIDGVKVCGVCVP